MNVVWDRRGVQWCKTSIRKLLDGELKDVTMWVDGNEALNPLGLFSCWGPLSAERPTFLTLEEIS